MHELLDRLGEAIAALKRKSGGDPDPSPSLPSPTSPAPSATKTAESRSVQDSLSGGLGMRIDVDPYEEGFLAKVPVTALRSSGVRLAESALPGQDGVRPAVVIATDNAIRNAEHRLMRILGEGWVAKAETFSAPPEGRLWFTLARRTSPT